MFESVAMELDGMPEATVLTMVSAGGETTISFGRRLVFEYSDMDLGMRNLAITSLRNAGVPGIEIAKMFGLSAEQVSRTRTRVKRHGSAGLAPLRGRPLKLSPRDVTTARRMIATGSTKTEIAEHFGVSRSVIREALGKLDPVAHDQPLELEDPSAHEAQEPRTGAPDDETPDEVEPTSVTLVTTGTPLTEMVVPATQVPLGLARIATGEHSSRYAGAALLYPYLNMVEAEEIFSTLVSGRTRRYDDLSVLATAVMGFALGIDTVEGAKHLRRADAGALVGISVIPELRTLRQRLIELADGSDPLALQRSFATNTLRADPSMSPVYYVDDHFVAYAGARPVAKGWNTKRRHAQKGRDDTLVCDSRGRAVVFNSGEPSGLASTMGSVLAQLRQVVGSEAPVMLGFDRGGAFAVAFTACRDAGMDWITYRRGKLATTTASPKRSWVERAGKRIVVDVADETVHLKGYGIARQLTLFESGAPVLQILTSDMVGSGANLVCWLRGRWSIENLFKYAAEHAGIDSIASYLMDEVEDDRLVANPERRSGRDALADAKSTLAVAERALAQLLCDPAKEAGEKNTLIDALTADIEVATAGVQAAKAALIGVPAKVASTTLDPKAKRALMRLERRGLQMVYRLLAFNSEAWLAEHFNAYLEDADEFRAIMRNLLHLGGSFRYERTEIIVTLDRPDTPRVARALELLIEELNAHGAHLLGDRRALRYQLTETS